MKNFKQLLVWQKGMQIWKEVYSLSKELPSEERFGLASQVSRASASIPANIAEGSGRDGKKDQARFLQFALGSCFELETFLIGFKMIGLASEDRIDTNLDLVDEEQKIIMSFKRKIESDSQLETHSLIKEKI